MKVEYTEETLARAAHGENLTEDEVKKVRNFLVTIANLGRIGRFVLWTVITAGALAAAVQQMRAGWQTMY